MKKARNLWKKDVKLGHGTAMPMAGYGLEGMDVDGNGVDARGKDERGGFNATRDI